MQVCYSETLVICCISLSAAIDFAHTPSWPNLLFTHALHFYKHNWIKQHDHSYNMKNVYAITNTGSYIHSTICHTYYWSCNVNIRSCSHNAMHSPSYYHFIIGASLSEPHTSDESSDFLCVCIYIYIFGASLSEPHTSVTALRTCVCMAVCLSVCGHIPKILNERVEILILRRWGRGPLRRSSSVCREAWRLECSVGYLEMRWLKLKYTWQLPIDGRLPTGSTNLITTVVEVGASGKGHQHKRHL